MCGSLLNDKREKKEKIPFFFQLTHLMLVLLVINIEMRRNKIRDWKKTTRLNN